MASSDGIPVETTTTTSTLAKILSKQKYGQPTFDVPLPQEGPGINKEFKIKKNNPLFVSIEGYADYQKRNILRHLYRHGMLHMDQQSKNTRYIMGLKFPDHPWQQTYYTYACYVPFMHDFDYYPPGSPYHNPYYHHPYNYLHINFLYDKLNAISLEKEANVRKYDQEYNQQYYAEVFQGKVENIFVIGCVNWNLEYLSPQLDRKDRCTQQVVEAVTKELISDEIARDTVRCIGVENYTIRSKGLCTVALIDAVNDDRTIQHLHSNIVRHNFHERIQRTFPDVSASGNDSGFDEVYIDYFYIPDGSYLLHKLGKNKFGTVTIPKFATTPGVLRKGGKIMIPFNKFYFDELINNWEVACIGDLFTIRFLRRGKLDENKLWTATQKICKEVGGNKNFFKYFDKQVNQEETYCVASKCGLKLDKLRQIAQQGRKKKWAQDILDDLLKGDDDDNNKTETQKLDVVRFMVLEKK